MNDPSDPQHSSSQPGSERARAQHGRQGFTHHGPEGFAAMRKAGRVAAELLDYIAPFVQPGVTTGEIDRLCAEWTTAHGAVSAPLNYRGFPKSICTSVNHVVCHGIPDPAKRLNNGDIVNIDVTPIVDGWHGDSSRMYYAGTPKLLARKLVEVTYDCLMRAIDVVRPGATFGDIGHAIQSHAEANRFSVVRDFCGHGIGRIFHEPPNVLHYSKYEDEKTGKVVEIKGDIIEEGMIFTIEPMINAGRFDVKVLEDRWTAVTKDRSLSAQFEHTVGVTHDGCEVFTLSPKGHTRPPYPV